MSVTFDLSAAIKAHRLSLGLTQGQYGTRFKVNADTLRLLENNRHYIDNLPMRTIDKLLGILHMDRKTFDPDFGRIEDARKELAWAKELGALDRHIADYLGLASATPVYKFFDYDGGKSTYHTARTVFALLEDDFRPFIMARQRNPQPTQETPQISDLELLRDKLEAKARLEGFVTWELEKAELVDGKLCWMSGTGIYRIELSLKDFRAYYARTNTLSVYRDYTKKPVPTFTPKKKAEPPKKIDPIAHYKQAEARDNASELFRMLFGG